MRSFLLSCSAFTILSGCVLSYGEPTSISVSYPDTTQDVQTSTQVIPAGETKFSVIVNFGEKITGFEEEDIRVSGGRITSFTSNSEGTVFVIGIEANLETWPNEITLDVIGTVEGEFGLVWTPDIQATFTYPESDYSFSERQTQSTLDKWGVSRASADTASAVVYSPDYTANLASGVLTATLEISAEDLELMSKGSPTGIDRYRGGVKIGDTTYSAELIQTKNGNLSLHIFDPAYIVLTNGETYSPDSLTGSHTYTGTLSLLDKNAPSVSSLDDFTLTANFTTDSFTVANGSNASSVVVLTGSGVLNSETGFIASDNLTLEYGGDSFNAIAFGNIRGDGTNVNDVTGLFYSNEIISEGPYGDMPNYVGTFVGTAPLVSP